MSDTYQATAQNANLTAPTSAADGVREKDFQNGNHEHLHSEMDQDTALRKIQTSGSISISPELFEKIYLSPQNKVAGDLRKTFGNPTPVALVGFLLSLTPLSCDLMGWRGAGGNGAASIGPYFGFGGIGMILGGLGEWVLGNTFPSVVFISFGGFWVSFGLTLWPYSGSISNYNGMVGPTGKPEPKGLDTVGFNASFAFFLMFMAILCLVYTICALRTNAILFFILLLLVPAFSLLAAAYWDIAEGKTTPATTYILTAGALTFIVDMLGWYLLLAIMLAALDFPFQLPVFDLSHIIKGASDKAKAKEEYSA